MHRRSFFKLAGALLLAPTAAKAIDFGALAAPAAAEETFITAASGAHYFQPMQHVELAGEIMRITSISDEGFTVTRGHAHDR